jgi:hypothetical protein
MMLTINPKWKHLENPWIGAMVKISEQIRQFELLNPDLLPDLRKYPSVIIASDYGGQHKGAEYQTLSFFLGIPIW